MAFHIDPEFQALLPEQSKDEFARLKAKISKEGPLPGSVTVALIGGNRKVLIDGHHTVRACKEAKVPEPEPRILEFQTREEVVEWIVNHQLSRRNLSDMHKAYFIGKKYLQEKKETGRPEKGATVAPFSGKTADKVAEETGTSPRTVKNNAEFAAAVDKIGEQKGPAAVKEILNGQAGTKKQVVDSVKPLLCSRCLRIGAVADCAMCKEVRKGNRPKEEEEKPPITPEDKMKGYNLELEKWCRRLKSVADEMPDGPWLQELNKRDGAKRKLEDCAKTIRSAKGHTVCTKCSGKGCPTCRKTGWMTLYAFQQL